MNSLLRPNCGTLVFLSATLLLARMAWRSHGTNNADMVRNLKANGIIKSDSVYNAMLAVDRAHYCPNSPYVDAPQSIGYSATISAPHMHALALEQLKDHLLPGEKALDVGSGSGYLVACIANMVNETGQVIGIEHIPELVTLSVNNLNADKPDYLKSNRVKIVVGDGRLGYPEGAPYSAIHVGAAAPTIPEALIEQLKNGGRLVVPVGPRDGEQILTQIDKAMDGTTTLKKLMSVVFVPLTDKDNQLQAGASSRPRFARIARRILLYQYAKTVLRQRLENK
ncbi:protein-L-isoaspartate(D-aspartate) O-methyltransferase isoform X1 [Plutella xylostella]|uniref:protein-L-isoaspartate(D-aspartate) O-methyltransferase isoform X1 n=1 Tax=Plutella xylostella TaxID=51655 RepID=UPI002032E718|nr:protein-L-isoaspartate(D-aspartate) O-methyltransferase isoform X1 [Plutella xylostella]